MLSTRFKQAYFVAFFRGFCYYIVGVAESFQNLSTIQPPPTNNTTYKI